MALTTDQKSSLLFKKWLGKGETNTLRQFFEEPYSGRSVVLQNQIWTDSELIPVPAPTLLDGQDDGIVKYYVDLTLTAVPGTANSFQSDSLIDSISFNYGDGSYNYAIKDHIGSSIPFGQGDWIVDTEAGTLTFYGDSGAPDYPDLSGAPTVTFYQYIGRKGGGSGESLWYRGGVGSPTQATILSNSGDTVVIGDIIGSPLPIDYALALQITGDTQIIGNLTLEYGTNVNEIVDSVTGSPVGIGSWSTDDQLATAAATYDFIYDLGLILTDTYVAVGTGTGIEGDVNFTWDGSILDVGGEIHFGTYGILINDSRGLLLGTSSSLGTNVVISTTGAYSHGIPTDIQGNYNVYVGNDGLSSAATGDNNVMIGHWAGYNFTTASYSIGIGYSALEHSETGTNNIGIGSNTLDGNNGSNNLGMLNRGGYGSHGDDNIYIGYYSGFGVTGDSNIGFGRLSLYNATGSDNIAIGDTALRDITGSKNIAIGYNVGNYYNNGASVSNRLLIDNEYKANDEYFIEGDMASNWLRLRSTVTIYTGLVLPFSPTLGFVLTSDASGIATWQDPNLLIDTHNHYLSELLDVTITGSPIGTGDILKWSGTAWENVADETGDNYYLSAVDAIDISAVDFTITGGADILNVDFSHTIESHTDVTITGSPIGTGDILKWSGVAWENVADETGDNYYVETVSFNTLDGILTFERTSPLIDLTVNLDGRYEEEFVKGDILPGDSNQLTVTGGTGVLYINDTTLTIVHGIIASASTDLVLSGDIFDAFSGKVDIGLNPADNSIAVWSDGTTIEGDTNFTWDGTLLDISGAIQLSIGTSVNEIIDSVTGSPVGTGSSVGIGSWSTDNQLATAAAIYEFVNDAIGSLPSDIYVTGASFNTTDGIITLTRSAGESDLTFDLDGRYSLDTHNHYLSELLDVTITGSPIPTGDILKYNGTAWENVADETGLNYYLSDVTINSINDVDFIMSGGALNIEGIDFSHTIESHTDVIITGSPGILLNDILKWTGSSWENVEEYSYTHPIESGDDINLDTTTSQVIDTLIVTTNTLGHVTAASVTTRVLTPGDIGAEVAFTKGNLTSGTAQLTLLPGTGTGVLVDTSVELSIAIGTIADTSLVLVTSGDIYTALIGKVDIGTTPVTNYIGVWEDPTTMLGDINFTWDGSILDVNGTLHIGKIVATANNDVIIEGSSALGTGNEPNVIIHGLKLYTPGDVDAIYAAGARGNVFVGIDMAKSTLVGDFNVGVGLSAGHSITTGNNNAYFGYQAGIINATGDENSSFGSDAGVRNLGNYNVDFGAFAGNSFLMSGITTNSANTNIGYKAGYQYENATPPTTLYENTYIGYGAGEWNQGGQKNVFMGVYAGYAAEYTEQSIFIGNSVGLGWSGGNNYLLIDNDTVPSGDYFIKGNMDTNELTINGSFKLNTSTSVNDIVESIAGSPNGIGLWSTDDQLATAAAIYELVNNAIGTLPSDIYVTTGSFNTSDGIITLTRTAGQSDITIDIDDRYSLDTHNHTLDSLSNVTVTSIQINDILKWSGTTWENVADETGLNYYLSGITVNSISDVDFTMTGIADITGIDFGHDLETHDNVTIISLTTDDILKWSGTAWENVAEYSYTHPTESGDDIDLDTVTNQVIDTLIVTTNTLGHVTAASVTTRVLTPGDIGAEIAFTKYDLSSATTSQLTLTNGTSAIIGADVALSIVHGAIALGSTDLVLSGDIYDAINVLSGDNFYLSAVDASDISAVDFTITDGTDVLNVNFSHTLDSHTDVIITGSPIGTGDILKWSGTAWENVSDETGDNYYLSDVTVNSISDVDFIMSGGIGNIEGIDFGHDLETHDNVTITSLTIDDILKWNGAAWENVAEYTHPTESGDDINLETTTNQVIHRLAITTNTLGHVTAALTTTRVLTPGDIGAEIAFTKYDLSSATTNQLTLTNGKGAIIGSDVALSIVHGIIASGSTDLVLSGDIYDAISGLSGDNFYLSAVDATDISAVDFTITGGTDVLNVNFGHTLDSHTDVTITGSPIGTGDILKWSGITWENVADETGLNYYVENISFNTLDGILTLERTSPLGDLTVDLDGRYEEEFTKGNLTSGTAQLTLTAGTGTGVLVDTSVELSIAIGAIASASTDLVTSGDIYDAIQQTALGYVDYTGTPVNNQVAVFTDEDTIEGDGDFLWNGVGVTISSDTNGPAFLLNLHNANTGTQATTEIRFNVASSSSYAGIIGTAAPAHSTYSTEFFFVNKQTGGSFTWYNYLGTQLASITSGGTATFTGELFVTDGTGDTFFEMIPGNSFVIDSNTNRIIEIVLDAVGYESIDFNTNAGHFNIDTNSFIVAPGGFPIIETTGLASSGNTYIQLGDIDAEAWATILTIDDANLKVNITNSLQLNTSQLVNDIINSTTGLSAASLDTDLVTAKAVWDAISGLSGDNFYLSAVDATDISAVDFTITGGTDILNVDFSHTIESHTDVTITGSPIGTGDILKWSGTAWENVADETGDNYYVDNISFNTLDGILTLERISLGDLTVDLDGRYEEEFTKGDILPGDSNQLTVTGGTGVLYINDTTLTIVHGAIASASTDLVLSGDIFDAFSGKVDIGLNPADNSIAIWSDGTTIEGDTNFTWNGTLLNISGAMQLSIGTSVNEIVDSVTGSPAGIGVWSTDDQLVTAKAIYELNAISDTYVVVGTGTGIEGDPNFTWDGTTLEVVGNLYITEDTYIGYMDVYLDPSDDPYVDIYVANELEENTSSIYMSINTVEIFTTALTGSGAISTDAITTTVENSNSVDIRANNINFTNNTSSAFTGDVIDTYFRARRIQGQNVNYARIQGYVESPVNDAQYGSIRFGVSVNGTLLDDNIVDMLKLDEDGMTLQLGTSVNEIVNSVTGSPNGIGSWSTDDQLVTSKAIYEFVNDAIGTLPSDIYVTGASFNTTDGIITLTRSAGESDIIVDIDNRYSLDTHNHTLDSLSNVTVTSIQPNDILKYNGSAWENVADETGLNYYLSDVTVNSISDIDFIMSGGIANIEGIDFSHTHPISEIVSLQTELDDKVNIGTTPAFNYIGVWENTTDMMGYSTFIYDGTDMTVTAGSIITDTSFIIDALQLLTIEATTHGASDIIQMSDAGSRDFIGMNSNQGVWIGSPIVGELPGFGDLTIYGQSANDTFLSITSEDGNKQYIDFYDYTGSSFSFGNNTTSNKMELWTDVSLGGGSILLAIDAAGLTLFDTYTLPIADGSADYILATDGAGTVSWQSLSAVGSVIGSGVAGQVAYWDATDSITGDSSFTWDGTDFIITTGRARANNIIAYGSSVGWPSGIGFYTATYMYGDIGRLFVYNGSTYGDLAIGDYNSGNPNIMLKVGGDVGINKGLPLYKLDVDGTIAGTGFGLTNITTVLVDEIVDSITGSPVGIGDWSTDDQLATSKSIVEYVDSIVSGIIIAPAAPTTLVLTEVTSTIDVQFVADINNDAYEIWSSQTSSSAGFKKVADIKKDDITATLNITDDTYTRKSQIWYKIYAIKNGIYSIALTGNITPINDVADVTNILMDEFTEAYVMTWDNPIDRRLDYIEVKVDAQLIEANLAEGSSSSVYQGLASNFTYKILNADIDKYHQFWIYTITKT